MKKRIYVLDQEGAIFIAAMKVLQVEQLNFKSRTGGEIRVRDVEYKNRKCRDHVEYAMHLDTVQNKRRTENKAVKNTDTYNYTRKANVAIIVTEPKKKDAMSQDKK